MNEPIQKVLEAYKNLRNVLGKPPSSREFYEVFSKRELCKAFEGGNAYSRLQNLAGDSPNKFSSKKSDLREILINWGGLARKTLSEYNKLPIASDWLINNLSPSISGIEKSHKVKWSDIPLLFCSEFSNVAEWGDVLLSIPASVNNTEIKELANEECFVYLMKDIRNGLYKIGISNNPGIREKTLQSEQPKIQLVAAKKYINRKIALNIEKALHQTYSHKRKRGEWFHLDYEDIGEITITLNN
ncbi:GIY-YIG nuclease family protein [Methylobacillus gramineus]|uniref:GIY-YIG nuclease family protein n=1 Tax=Methylobacillus gramineus TaxID=755169 RepID=UPI001D0014E6|nr:GIY-YIG nuclease family protein [Methylobacillus gramineus]MCB5186229.1 GIY-YIG nuclease family protein [Methylobacillus gramineus]